MVIGLYNNIGKISGFNHTSDLAGARLGGWVGDEASIIVGFVLPCRYSIIMRQQQSPFIWAQLVRVLMILDAFARSSVRWNRS